MIHFRHKWKVYSVERVWSSFVWSSDEDEGRPVTFFKERCQTCRKVRRKKIDGHWSLTELEDGR